MSIIIKAENISKSYIIRHQQKERYSVLSEVISKKMKNIFSRSPANDNSTYEEFWALKDIDFEIEKGDRIGIIGRNGAGKSTLLKILSRITEPSTGRISIKGRTASLLEVGTGFHPELTGRENIFLNGSILAMTKAEIKSKFDEIVGFAEVEKFLDTPVKRYSSGMYVRLAFAVAAHLEPEVLIVDEVLAVGDAHFQRKCLGKMKDVSSEGRTILFVSHNMEAVQKLCVKGLLLHKGMLIESGPIDSVVTKYVQVNSSQKSCYEIKLPDNHNFSVYAYKLCVEDENANAVSEIPLGKPWQVRIFFTVNKKTSGFVIALGVSTMLDMPLQTTWAAPQDIDCGDYEVIFTNSEIIYTEGQYKLIVGLSSHKRVIQYTEGAGFITVSDVSAIYNDARVNTKSGILINQMKTVISKTKG